jgi:putative transposase
MPRRRRTGTAGIVHHVLNRACRRATLFSDPEQYDTFVAVLEEARRLFGMRVLAFVVMPNHWHLILWPASDLHLSQFMHWLTLTHTKRWHVSHRTAGTGPLYQGRYKAIPVQADGHFYTATRYVERNPVRAWLVDGAQEWRWSSAWHRVNTCDLELLDTWPVPMPLDWLSHVNEPQNQIDLSSVREAIAKGRPFGDAQWTDRAIAAFDLQRTIHPQGRPSRNCKRLPTPTS